jgi:hypothetical protein
MRRASGSQSIGPMAERGDISRAAVARLPATLVAACALLAVPAAAQGAVTLGAVDPVAAPSQTCNGGVSFMQTATGGPTIAAPTAGVITRWRHRGDAGSGRLIMLRATGDPTMFILVGRSATQAFTSNVATDFPTRIPVLAGDLIGLRTVANNSSCQYDGNAGDDQRNSGASPFPPDGFTQTFGNDTFDLRLNLEADLEPDADGDGFGDETQDGCATDPAVQTACPPTGLTSDPSSSSDDLTPRIKGSAQDGTTVTIYTDAACTNLAATGSAADFNGTGIEVTVADGSTTTFNASANGAIGGESNCSSDSVTYAEQDSPPAPPTSLATDPVGPANGNTPSVSGSAQPGSTVKIYTDATCSGMPAASDFSANFSGGGVLVSVPDNSTTTFHATATDNGGESDCSTAFATYTEVTPPAGAPAPAEDLPPDTSGPEVVLDAGGPQTLGRRVELDLTCDEDCDATARGRVIVRQRNAVGSRRLRRTRRVGLKSVSASLAANQQETLVLRLSKRKLKRIRRALRGEGARARAGIRVTTTDAAGNRATTRFTLRLQRRP